MRLSRFVLRSGRDGQRESDFRAGSFPTGRPDAAAVLLDYASAYIEAKPGAFDPVVGLRTAGSCVLLEDPLAFDLIHALAIINYANGDERALPWMPRMIEVQIRGVRCGVIIDGRCRICDYLYRAAWLSVLSGVGHEVDKHLLERVLLSLDLLKVVAQSELQRDASLLFMMKTGFISLRALGPQ